MGTYGRLTMTRNKTSKTRQMSRYFGESCAKLNATTTVLETERTWANVFTRKSTD